MVRPVEYRPPPPPPRRTERKRQERTQKKQGVEGKQNLPENYRKFYDAIMKASKKYGIPASVLFGILSRETGGQLINGDGGHGRGPWQIDDRSHQQWLATHDAMNIEQSTDYAAGLLRSNIDYFKNKGLSGDDALRAGIAAYNCGAGNVNPPNYDARTANGNYSADVLRRAEDFAKALGGEKIEFNETPISGTSSGGGGGGTSSGGGVGGSSGSSGGTGVSSSTEKADFDTKFSANLFRGLLSAVDSGSVDEVEAELKKMFPGAKAKDLKNLAKLIMSNPALATAVKGSPALLQQLASDPKLVKQLAKDPGLVQQVAEKAEIGTGANSSLTSDGYQKTPDDRPVQLSPVGGAFLKIDNVLQDLVDEVQGKVREANSRSRA